MSSKEQLIDRWMNDTEFREQFRKDPQGSVARLGIDLAPSELGLLAGLDSHTSDQQLAARLSKSGHRGEHNC